MNTAQRFYPGGFLPGTQAKVIDRTFLGMEGTVLDPEEAYAVWERVGGQRPTAKDCTRKVCVLLPVFDNPVPVFLDPFQIEARPG